MPESPTTPVPPVAAADPSPVGRRSTRRDLDVPPRGAAGRAPAGDGPAPVVGRPPVGAPAAPGPDEASWLADWASGAWVGEIPPPEPPARTDRTDVDRTVPGTPHVVPAANGTAPASSETPEDPDHAAPAPHARAGLPDTGPARTRLGPTPSTRHPPHPGCPDPARPGSPGAGRRGPPPPPPPAHRRRAGRAAGTGRARRGHHRTGRRRGAHTGDGPARATPAGGAGDGARGRARGGTRPEAATAPRRGPGRPAHPHRTGPAAAAARGARGPRERRRTDPP